MHSAAPCASRGTGSLALARFRRGSARRRHAGIPRNFSHPAHRRSDGSLWAAIVAIPPFAGLAIIDFLARGSFAVIPGQWTGACG